MLWKSDENSNCKCIDKTVNVNICTAGDCEYYNQNPVDCSPGNTLRNIIGSFVDAVNVFFFNPAR